MKQEAYILTYVLRDDPYKVAEKQNNTPIENKNLQQGESSQVQIKNANALIDDIFGKPSSKKTTTTAKVVVAEESKSMPMPEEKPIVPVPVVQLEIPKVKKSKKTVPVVSEPTPMEVEKEIAEEEHEEFKSLIKLALPKKTSIPLL